MVVPKNYFMFGFAWDMMLVMELTKAIRNEPCGHRMWTTVH